MEEIPAPEDAGRPVVTQLSKTRRQAALGFILVTVLLDVSSLGIMIPVLPNLVKEMVGGATEVATIWTGVFASCWGLLQFIFSPIQGMLSDRFGRRPVLLISIFGLSADYLFMAFAPTLAWLFVGRMINGITAASFSTAGAYVADITAPEDRARRFGLVGAAFGAGFIIGPAIGGALGDPSLDLPFIGHLSEEARLRVPFFAAATLGAINWFYGLLVLPESLPKERREPRFNWRKANPVGSFKLLRRHNDLFGMAGVTFLFQLAHNVLPAVFVLYIGYRYGWTPGNAGFLLMAVGLANVVVQMFFVGPAVKNIGERGVLLIGLLSAVAGLMIYGLAPNGLLFLIGIPVMAFSGFIGPGLQGLMTRRVEPNEQGQLQGANSAIMAISAIIGPQIFTHVFQWSIVAGGGVLISGAPVILAAMIMAAGFVLAVFVAKLPQSEIRQDADPVAP